jgi:hypothetical protein
MPDLIHYPTIDDAMLTPFRVLRVLIQANPDLFERPDCPYTPDQRMLLQAMIKGGAEAARTSFLAGADDPYEALQEQIALTLEDIRDLEKTLSALDQRDKVQFLKAKPGLLEKLIELQERSANMKTLSDFMRRVYRFIDKEMDADQRTKLVEAVGGFIDER